MLDKTAAMFIGLASKANDSETGYFNTVGIYANNQLKTNGCPTLEIDNHNLKDTKVVKIEIDFAKDSCE